MASSITLTNLKCLRALDGILLGSLILLPLGILHNLLATVPFIFAKYAYIVPLIIIYKATYRIPFDTYKHREWKRVLRRLRFFAAGVLALSPFWGWWDSAPGNIYIQINIALLILFSILYIYNLVTLSIVSAKESKWPAFAIFAKLTRVVIIYIMITPACAFLFAITYISNSNSTWSIIIILLKYQDIIIPLIMTPLFMAALILILWGKNIEIHHCSTKRTADLSDI
jgi:hypothetical protein